MNTCCEETYALRGSALSLFSSFYFFFYVRLFHNISFVLANLVKWQNQAPQKQGAAPTRSEGPNPEGVEVQNVQIQVIGKRILLLISHQQADQDHL